MCYSKGLAFISYYQKMYQADMNGKRTFIGYTDRIYYTEEMSLEEIWTLFKAILDYQNWNEIWDLGNIKFVWSRIKKEMEENNQKWNDTKKARSDAWKKHTWNQYTKGDTKWKAQNNTVEQMEQNGTSGTNGTVSVSVNRLLSKDNNVDESTEQKSDNEMLYESYPFKWKWIDKQVCDKLIAKQLEQWATIKWMLKEMELEKLELRINQWLSYRYWKKFETWIKEYVEWMADSEDRLRKLLTEHRKRLENWPNYKKNPRDEICDLFGADYVKKLFMETKQWVKLFTT